MDRKIPQDRWLNEEDNAERMDDKDLAWMDDFLLQNGVLVRMTRRT
jgi:hypothetical protein